jgi:hypothetical protein
MFIESSADDSKRKSSADSAGVREPDAQKSDRFLRWFKSGAALVAYREPQQCLLCGKKGRMFIELDGAEICYVDYEDAGFDFSRAVS